MSTQLLQILHPLHNLSLTYLKTIVSICFNHWNSLLQAFNMIPSWNQQISETFQGFLTVFCRFHPPQKKKSHWIQPGTKNSSPAAWSWSFSETSRSKPRGGGSTLPAKPTHPNTASHRYRPLVTATGTLNLLCQALLFSVTLPEGFTAQGSVFKCNHLAYHSMVVDHVWSHLRKQKLSDF